jgi:hypothetical protein
LGYEAAADRYDDDIVHDDAADDEHDRHEDHLVVDGGHQPIAIGLVDRLVVDHSNLIINDVEPVGFLRPDLSGPEQRAVHAQTRAHEHRSLGKSSQEHGDEVDRRSDPRKCHRGRP